MCGRCSELQKVRDTDQERYDADGLHGGVAHRFGELRAHQGADARADEHGNDVYGGSQPHENSQYSRSTAEASLCIILTVVASFAGV